MNNGEEALFCALGHSLNVGKKNEGRSHLASPLNKFSKILRLINPKRRTSILAKYHLIGVMVILESRYRAIAL